MELYSDSDTSSELDYGSSQSSSPRSNYNIDELSENLKPKFSQTPTEFDNAPWNL
jgi:hypothetical protein